MWAFIVLEAWNNYGASDMAGFLRDIGTPSIKMTYEDTDGFNSSSGFYAKVENGWAVRYKTEFLVNDGLSSMMDTMRLG